MKVVFILFLTCLRVIEISAVETCSKNRNQILFVELLIKDLHQETWDKDEISCQRQMLKILNNARNATLWATWILDSLQFPTGVLYGSRYHLSNYDQCLKAPWSASQPLRTQYCVADVQLNNVVPTKPSNGFIDEYNTAEDYLNTLTFYSHELNKVTWGVCVPDSCGTKSLPKVLKMMLRHSHLGSLALDPKITISLCQVSSKPTPYSTGILFFGSFFAIIFAGAVFSTCYVRKSKAHAPSLIKTFNMEKNMSDLVKESSDDLKVLHGMRALSSHLVVALHYIMYANALGVGNFLDLEKTLQWIFPVFGHLDLVTDTFFMMSGLLLMKGFMGKWDNPEHPVRVLCKRYLRLMGPFAFTMMYVGLASDCGADGPLWPALIGRDQRACIHKWWHGVLMLNNYIESYDICHVVTWYISSDFHFTILGTVLFYIFRADRRTGILAFSTMAVLSVLLPGYVTFANRLNAVPVLDMFAKTAILKRDPGTRVVNDLGTRYIKSHYRMGSYLVGLAMGYVLGVYKPSQFRGTLSKMQSVLISLLAGSLAVACLILGGLFYSRPYDVTEAVVFAATNRIVWASAMGAIVLVCEYGALPLVKSFLQWGAFAPFSRLSYGLYLLHTLFIQRRVYAMRSPNYIDFFTMLLDISGVISLATIASLLMWLLIEAPLANITNLFLNTKSSQIPSAVPEKRIGDTVVNGGSVQRNVINGEPKRSNGSL